MNDITKQKQTHRYREIVVTSGKREVGRGKIGVGGQEVQTTRGIK